MDFTRDIKSPIKEYAARKSLGRRVSFASHAQVRVFEKDQNRGDAHPSSPVAGPSSQTAAPVNDENNYPGASSMARRRSSLRRSVAFSENGEASMDMESDLESSPLPANFLADGSFLQDEASCDVSGTWGEEVDMDITTTNILANKSRKSSIGLASLPREDAALDDPFSEDVTQGSMGDLSGVQAAPTEFTVPLNKSLRKPEPPTAEWLALRAITHAGEDSPYEPPAFDLDDDEMLDRGDGMDLGEDEDEGEGDMDLTEAETRLRRMRESLGLTNAPQEDSFTSSEGSSFDAGDNVTVNITSAWRRESLGTDSSSVMDPMNVQSTSGENIADEAVNRALPHTPSVDEPDGPSYQHGPHAPATPSAPTASVNATDPPRDTSDHRPPPVFSKPGPVFSAPKNRPPSPSKPKSPASPRKAGTAAFALPVTRPQPKKRLLSDSVDDGVFSRLEDQQNSVRGPTEHNTPTAASTSGLAKPVSITSASRRSSAGGLRRPSGYFAQRRSLVPSDVSNMPRPLSPRKKISSPGVNATESSEIDQDLVNTGRENVEPSPSLQLLPVHAEDATKETSVSGSSSLSPIQPPPLPTVTEPTPEPGTPAMHSTDGPSHTDATEEWRNNVRTSNLVDEDEGVSNHPRTNS